MYFRFVNSYATNTVKPDMWIVLSSSLVFCRPQVGKQESTQAYSDGYKGATQRIGFSLLQALE